MPKGKLKSKYGGYKKTYSLKLKKTKHNTMYKYKKKK